MRVRRPPRALLCLVCLAGAAASAEEEPPAPAPAALDQPSGPVAEPEPTKDVFDVLRQLRHKPEPPPPGPEDYKRWMVALAPVLTYGPTSGFGLGFAGNMAAFAGTPSTTRISSIVASVTATTKEQVAFLNAQTFGSEEAGEELFESFAPGGGIGFRLMLNKRSQTNLCLDVGWGQGGSRAVYFAVQEAF